MADTPQTSAPKEPASSSQSKTSQPSAGQSPTPQSAPGKTTSGKSEAPQETAQPKSQAPSAQDESAAPSTQGDPSYSCNVGSSTLKECFPDPVFRTYLAYAHPLDNNSVTSGAQYDNTVVTAAWAGGITWIEGVDFTQAHLAPGQSVHDIRGIQIFNNLTHFTASSLRVAGFSAVTDYSPMSHLANLGTVDFSYIGSKAAPGNINHANLTSWNSANMPALHTMNFTDSTFWDGFQLSRLSGLTHLNLEHTSLGTNGDNNTEDVAAFKNFDEMFPNMQTLDISRCESLHEYTDFNPLTRMSNLRTLNAEGIGHGIHGTIPEPMSRMTQLSVLDMSDNELTDVSTLASLTNLLQLDVSWNGLDDISPLSSLTHLTNLNAGNQQVQIQEFVANPDVTIPAGTLVNTRQSPIPNFEKSACYYYTKTPSGIGKACVDPNTVDVTTPNSVKLTNPHVETPPSNLGADALEQLMSGQLRNGLIAVPFSTDVKNTTGQNIGVFGGLLAPTVRVPQVVIDLRGGTLDGTDNPGIRQVVSGTLMPKINRPDRSTQNGASDTFKDWKMCVTGATKKPGTCSYANASDFDPTKTVITDDTTIYAHWQSDDTYTATFNTNTKNPKIWQQTVLAGQKLFEPKDKQPEFAGHTFEGWYTDRWFGVRYQFGNCLNKDIELFAHWSLTPSKPKTVNYNVFFNTQNGEDSLQQSVPQGGQAKRPSMNPSKSGYHFAGWYNKADGGNQYDFKTLINTDTIVYAHWTPAGSNTPEPTPAPPSPSAQIVNRYVTIQNYYTTNNTTNNANNANNANPSSSNSSNSTRSNGNTFNLFRNANDGNAGNGNGNGTVPQQQASPQNNGRKKVCRANNISNVNPSIPQEDRAIGNVRSIADYDPQCVAAPPMGTVNTQTHGSMSWLWLLLLMFLLLIPFLLKHDRLPDIGQHKSPAIYHYND